MNEEYKFKRRKTRKKRAPRLTGLRAEIQKAYRKTPMYQLDVLLKEETKWSRKQTIAQNKLAIVRRKITKFAKEQTTKATKKEISYVKTNAKN